MWAALGAGVAVVATAVAVLGPAHPDRTVVRWPEARAAADAPAAVRDGATFTPFLLSEHVPERLEVVVPCAAAVRPGTVFATTRDATTERRLAVTSSAGALEVRVGAELVVTAPVPQTAAACTFELTATSHGDGTAAWTLVTGTDTAVGSMTAPVLSGFASDADPRRTGVVATVTTADAGTHPSARQWVAIVVALLAVAAVLGSVLRPRTRPGPERPGARRRVERRVDAAVVAVLVPWALLGPWFYDDGWLMATVRARAGSGSFHNYFDTLATQMPLGFLHHVVLWPFAVADPPFLVWRVVPLVACVATWAALRRLFARILPTAAISDVVTLAAVFLVAACGWLITLRPEPVVALASVLVMARVVDFRASLESRSLGLAVGFAALACTLHPSGAVAAAPLVLTVGPLRRVLRLGLGASVERAAAVACGGALGVLALFADSDLAHWRRARATFAGDGFHGNGMFDEIGRYRDLLHNGTAAMLLSVLLGALAVASWSVRTAARGALGARSNRVGRDTWVPGAALLVGVVLLSLTPSKWIYHFGSLAGLATLAVGVEVAQLRALATDRSRPSVRRVVVATTVVASALVGERALRRPTDPQYFLGIGAPHLGVLRTSILWVAVAVVVLAVGLLRRRAAAWSIAGVGALVVATSSWSSIVVPAADGPMWAIPHAGVDDLLHGGCRDVMAIDVSDPRDAQVLVPETAIGDQLVGPGTAAAPRRTSSPWFAVADPRADLLITYRQVSSTNGLGITLEWATTGAEVSGRSPVPLVVPWGSVYGPPPPSRTQRVRPGVAAPGATKVRVVLDDASDADDLVVARPVAVLPRPLGTVLAGRTVLVSPPQLPLLRCPSPPVVGHGVAAMPDAFIGFELLLDLAEIPELGSRTGPWFLAPDAYDTRTVLGWLTDVHAFTVTLRDDRAAPTDVPIAVDRAR